MFGALEQIVDADAGAETKGMAIPPCDAVMKQGEIVFG
jgi:hypothetical protein